MELGTSRRHVHQRATSRAISPKGSMRASCSSPNTPVSTHNPEASRYACCRRCKRDQGRWRAVVRPLRAAIPPSHRRPPDTTSRRPRCKRLRRSRGPRRLRPDVPRALPRRWAMATPPCRKGSRCRAVRASRLLPRFASSPAGAYRGLGCWKKRIAEPRKNRAGRVSLRRCVSPPWPSACRCWSRAAAARPLHRWSLSATRSQSSDRRRSAERFGEKPGAGSPRPLDG